MVGSVEKLFRVTPPPPNKDPYYSPETDNLLMHNSKCQHLHVSQIYPMLIILKYTLTSILGPGVL